MMLLDCYSASTYTNRPSSLLYVYFEATVYSKFPNFNAFSCFHNSPLCHRPAFLSFCLPFMVAVSFYIAFSSIRGRSLCSKRAFS